MTVSGKKLLLPVKTKEANETNRAKFYDNLFWINLICKLTSVTGLTSDHLASLKNIYRWKYCFKQALKLRNWHQYLTNVRLVGGHPVWKWKTWTEADKRELKEATFWTTHAPIGSQSSCLLDITTRACWCLCSRKRRLLKFSNNEIKHTLWNGLLHVMLSNFGRRVTEKLKNKFSYYNF
jgi:hypothetical protein